MAPSRLTDSQKQELLVRYRAGDSSAALAAVYGCSANTVSRTVRTLLTPEEYDELKSVRARAATTTPQADQLKAPEQPEAAKDLGQPSERLVELEPLEAEDNAEEDDGSANLALDDADDFGDDDADDVGDDEAFDGPSDDVFQEIAVLPVDLPQVSRVQVSCRPFASGVLPEYCEPSSRSNFRPNGEFWIPGITLLEFFQLFWSGENFVCDLSDSVIKCQPWKNGYRLRNKKLF